MRASWALLIPGALLAPAPAQAADWEMVPDRSELQFTATYEGQPAPGEFEELEVDLRFDPDAPESGHLKVRVDLGSADMGGAEVNQAIREPAWLNVAEFDRAVFVSDSIRAQGEDRFLAIGELRLKGTKEPVEVPFRWRRKDGRTILKGKVTIRRTRFGIGTGEWATEDPIGLDVRVRYKVTLRPEAEG